VVDRAVLQELLEVRTTRVLRKLPDGGGADGSGWRVHHVLFARAGYTEAARAEAAAAGAELVDLARLDAEL